MNDNNKIIDNSELIISNERLTKYLIEKNNSREKAINLYLENILISESFYMPIQWVEVCLRNVVNKKLSDVFNSD